MDLKAAINGPILSAVRQGAHTSCTAGELGLHAAEQELHFAKGDTPDAPKENMQF